MLRVTTLFIGRMLKWSDLLEWQNRGVLMTCQTQVRYKQLCKCGANLHCSTTSQLDKEQRICDITQSEWVHLARMSSITLQRHNDHVSPVASLPLIWKATCGGEQQAGAHLTLHLLRVFRGWICSLDSSIMQIFWGKNQKRDQEDWSREWVGRRWQSGWRAFIWVGRWRRRRRSGGRWWSRWGGSCK